MTEREQPQPSHDGNRGEELCALAGLAEFEREQEIGTTVRDIKHVLNIADRQITRLWADYTPQSEIDPLDPIAKSLRCIKDGVCMMLKILQLMRR